MAQQCVRVGVGVFIVQAGKVLLGERWGSHGQGSWALPGGHLELGESIEQCAAREVAEETGLAITGVKQVAFTNDLFTEEKKHYVTLFVKALGVSGEVQNLEPEKCKQWRWCDWNALPQPLFLPLQNFCAKPLDIINFD